jgi:hypothetical protein
MNKLGRLLDWRIGAVVALVGVGCAVYFFLLKPGTSRPQRPPDRQAPGPAWFADVTDQAGLRFVHDAGPDPQETRNYFMPQLMGSGAALFDFTPDGRIKYLYLLQNGGAKGARNRLYRQLPGGRFKDVSAGSGLDIAGYNMGVAVGDVNNDGLPDVLVTQYQGARLFLNNGDGTFTDVTREAGLHNPGWGCSAAFFDYNRDGWLDLVIANYVAYDPTVRCTDAKKRPDYCGPNKFPGQGARLFRNQGGSNNGFTLVWRGLLPLVVPRFRDVTKTSGLGAAKGRGLGVVCADFDGDGWPDMLVANDGEPNHLWINQQNGTFTEEAVPRGLAVNRLGTSEANMGIALGDVTGSGRFDVFITHVTEETNTLWRQKSRGLFQDQTARLGLVTTTQWRGTGFGTVLGDFDQDGGLDLAVVNGRVVRPHHLPSALGPRWSAYAERNQLLANDGPWGFRDISLDNPALCGTPNVARGLAYGDIDGDGALDLLVTTAGGKARLYRNVVPRRGHWLLIRAVDPRLGGRDAYGAEVRVRAGEQRWLRLVNPASSYLCSNDVRAHFGLGAAARVDEIEVRWPDGLVEVFPGCKADRRIVLARGAGKRGGKRRKERE